MRRFFTLAIVWLLVTGVSNWLLILFGSYIEQDWLWPSESKGLRFAIACAGGFWLVAIIGYALDEEA